jgi:hypothetical protein
VELKRISPEELAPFSEKEYVNNDSNFAFFALKYFVWCAQHPYLEN